MLVLLTSLSEDFAKRAEQSGLLRPAALQRVESGTLWDGSVPEPAYTPQEVISLTLDALQSNDEPQPSFGTALLRRFSTEEFQMAGEPQRLPPPALTAFFTTNQYNLLLDREGASWYFPAETCSFDDENAWQEVRFESDGAAAGENALLVKLGWSLVRSKGCWLTESVDWHDFRPDFRPGIGQEEWPRICG